MRKDNRTNLRADHGPHNRTQNPNQSKRGFMFYMLLIAGVLMLLLLAACEPVNIKTITKSKVTNHASLK